MPKINLLDSTIYNRISAGEVVERPASVIKELVENSLDAGACSIAVEIKKGGIEEISVTDNGCGIEFNDLKNAFLPHATSKISSLADLEGIRSLGFRGEALASIAAVGMVTMKTKTENSITGGEIAINGGTVERFAEAGCAQGTQTTVRNIFYNTPARAKFLKKPKSEEAEITNLLARFILVNSNKSFRYIVDGKTIYQSNGTGLKDAIYIVYGSEAVNNLIPVKSEYGGIKLTGYVGKPSYSKPNKTYQTISLNGRYIINSTVSAAIHNVYSEYLMKRNYPFYVLHMEMPFDSVDVNVHPNKLDVRFENTGTIYSLFFNSVGSAIAGYNREQIALFNQKNAAHAQESITQTSPQYAEPRPLRLAESEQNSKNTDSPAADHAHKPVSDDKERGENFPPADILHPFYKRPSQYQGFLHDSGAGTAESAARKSKALLEDPSPKEDDEKLPLPALAPEVPVCEQQNSLGIEQTYRVLGQVFHSYILIESGNDLLIIDQHAAHERLLFDRIRGEIDSRSVTSQNMLIPFVFTLNPLELEYFKLQVSYLTEIGFFVEEFGSNAFKISAVPHYLSGLDLRNFIDEIMQDMNNAKRSKTSDSIRDMLAQKACKAAVKAGMELEDIEIEKLLADMREGSVLQCPHGRPVIYVITNKDIEKWFKRIV